MYNCGKKNNLACLDELLIITCWRGGIIVGLFLMWEYAGGWGGNQRKAVCGKNRAVEVITGGQPV